jgi:hypothetical protein
MRSQFSQLVPSSFKSVRSLTSVRVSVVMSGSSSQTCCEITSIIVQSNGEPHILVMCWIIMVYVFVDLTTLVDVVDAVVDDITFGSVVDVAF